MISHNYKMLFYISGADQRKRQSSASLAFVRGFPQWQVNSLHKWPVTRKMFPFDDVIILFLMLFCSQRDRQLEETRMWWNLYYNRNDLEKSLFRKYTEDDIRSGRAPLTVRSCRLDEGEIMPSEGWMKGDNFGKFARKQYLPWHFWCGNNRHISQIP